jgi:hypothetical protein
MHTYFRTTVVIRIVFIIFVLVAYFSKQGTSSETHILKETAYERVRTPRNKISSRTTEYKVLRTTDGKKYSLYYSSVAETFEPGDTIVIQKNVLQKAVSVYKTNGAYIYPLSGPRDMISYFLLFGLGTLITLIFYPKRSFERTQYIVLLTSIVDLGMIVLYYIS